MLQILRKRTRAQTRMQAWMQAWMRTRMRWLKFSAGIVAITELILVIGLVLLPALPKPTPILVGAAVPGSASAAATPTPVATADPTSTTTAAATAPGPGVTAAATPTASSAPARTRAATPTAAELAAKPLLLLRAGEYIDLDDTTVKFLCKTTPGASIALYLGESPETLKLAATIKEYENQGFTISDLQPGKTYYYQIVAQLAVEPRAATSAVTSAATTAATSTVTSPATTADTRAVTDSATIATTAAANPRPAASKTKTQSGVLSLRKLAIAQSAIPAPTWARRAVFYEVFVRAFADGNGDGIGDLAGLKQRLPYLKQLGVNSLWLMPIFASPSYHGYDVADYYQIEPDYGTNAQFFDFLNEAHAQDFKVILDLVVNHTSSEHPWFVAASAAATGVTDAAATAASSVTTAVSSATTAASSATAADSATAATHPDHHGYKDFYVWADPFDDITQLAPNGQPLWHRSPRTNDSLSKSDYYQAVFWSGMPDLNFRLPQVRAEIEKIARYWLDPNGDGNPSDGVDGFRLDAAMYADTDSEVTHAWWRQFNDFVKSINPNAFLVAENWASPATIAPFLSDLDSSFNFRLADLILAAADGQSGNILSALAGIHNLYSIFSSDYIDATFLSNHDQARVATRLLGDPARLRLAAALLLTLPGTPFIYYGEELGQAGNKPDENIREPFDWYAAGQGPGQTDMLRWTSQPSRYNQPSDAVSVEEEASDPNSLLNYYRKLIAIRKANPILFTGEYTPIDTASTATPGAANGGGIAYIVSAPTPGIEPESESGAAANGSVQTNGYTLTVVHNTTPEPIHFPVNCGGTELLTGHKLPAGSKLLLAPGQSAIIKHTENANTTDNT